MWVVLLFVGMGILAIVDGVRAYMGIHKSWFCTTRIPTMLMPDLIFGSIPIGLGLLIMGLVMLAGYYEWSGESSAMLVMLCVVFPLAGLGVVFYIWQPRWLLPDWYHWLKANYGDLVPQLRADARRLGCAWLNLARTQEGLERWAEKVRQRHQAGP